MKTEKTSVEFFKRWLKAVRLAVERGTPRSMALEKTASVSFRMSLPSSSEVPNC